jgi:type II secretory pathway pseudopilin PulG
MKTLARRFGQAGYTVPEILVVCAIVGLVMAGLLSLMRTGSQTFTVGANRAEAQQTARLVIARMVQEIRTAGHDPRTTNFTAIAALAPPQVGFTIDNDWNATGAIETGLAVNFNGANRGERITYTVVANALRRQESFIDASPVEVTDALADITFQYLDVDDVSVASPHVAANAARIRTVVVTITSRPDIQASTSTGHVAVTTTNRTRVRNRT